MFTLSDTEWMGEARRREIYLASEARWSMEGVTVQSPQNAGDRLDKLKALLDRLNPTHTVSPTPRSKFESK